MSVRFTFARYNSLESVLLILIVITFAFAAFLPFVTYHFPHFVHDPEPTLDHAGYKTSVFLVCAGYALFAVSSSFFSGTLERVIQVASLIGIPGLAAFIYADANTLLEDTGIEFRFGRTITIIGVILSILFAFVHFIKTQKQKRSEHPADVLDQF